MKSATVFSMVLAVVGFNSQADAQLCAPAPTCGPSVTYSSGCVVAAPTCGPIVQEAPRFEEQIIEEMISVPETVMQKQTIQEQHVRYEQRPRTVTVYEQVPEVVNVNETVTVMTQQVRLQPVTRTGYQAVTQNVVRPVTVAVQGVENRVGIRQVVANVPVAVRRAVTQQCACTQSTPGMAPVQTLSQPTQRLVQTVENRQQVFNQQYTYQVPVTRNVTQYQTHQVTSYRPVQQTVNVPVAVQVPTQQVRTRQVTQMRTVPRQVTTYETVAVPYTTSREIEVPATRYVQKKVQRTIQVPVAPKVQAAPCEPCQL